MGKSLNVLFIEDSEEDAELTTTELIRGGFSPYAERVETRPGMLAALDKTTWDIILCDFRMPNFSAEDALMTLKASGQDIPFIITSGAVDAEDTVSLLKQGAHDFMNKEALARLVPAIEREIREADVRRQRRLAEDKVRILSSAVQQSPVSVLITDPRGVIEYVNRKFEQITGYDAADAIGRDLGFTILEQGGTEAMRTLREHIDAGTDWRGEFCSIRRDGQVFWEYVTISPLRNDSADITHFIIIKEDITVRRNYEEQLLHQARHDDLTGLANRVLMRERLHQALGKAGREGHQTAVICIDLDRFKNVNDTQGHASGDEVLKEAAARLSGCIYHRDTLARMGGDEFVIVIPKVTEKHNGTTIANRIIELFSRPFMVQGKEFAVTASIGIALFPQDGSTADVLQRNADLAMYQAKERGRNRYQYYSEEINIRLMAQLDLEARLRSPLLTQSLVLQYQPIYNMQTETISGYEALVRWHQPDGSLMLPGDFIPVAEEIGVIQDIDKWVMITACSELAMRMQDHQRPLRLSLNVSPKQLRLPDYADFVAQQLQLNQLPANLLELEITERVIMQNDDQTLANIRALGELGVRLSIDDFGTGYSSLSYLQKFPFKTLKIDRSFVDNVCHNEPTQRVVDTIISMARSLNMQVVAEGIETEEQYLYLKSHGCDLAQGFYLSRPIHGVDIPAQLTA
ncbi:GGDEF domain-containing response regulator [Cellvibrio polysaccharolyticus]|uniref:GGDEF domain-containing response regulator n=1 Tax=Cellvibrio polysaccharolyticus TaxID=2082724 RepID=A0A928V7I6_9GAMM|nr:GGDEF domain-containing response regulator [Cellvibrio polysaccharolyticus]MBE8718112.1 GGDEF domain-containing response regulator [Cellvibrio polysaccharolyticus]